ncbi:MAG: hypothetical protein OEX00_09765 [Gammaproteobacteria bacterium]|nr:hypothetical protein [Gammaproteobacteria bacterium]
MPIEQSEDNHDGDHPYEACNGKIAAKAKQWIFTDNYNPDGMNSL